MGFHLSITFGLETEKKCMENNCKIQKILLSFKGWSSSNVCRYKLFVGGQFWRSSRGTFGPFSRYSCWTWMGHCGRRANETGWFHFIKTTHFVSLYLLYFIDQKISVSPVGHVWGIDHREKIWYRKGACLETPLGQTWKSISGNLKQVKIFFCQHKKLLKALKKLNTNQLAMTFEIFKCQCVF